MKSRISKWLAPTVVDPKKAQQQYLLHLVLAGLALPGFAFGVVALVLWAFGLTPIAGALAGFLVQPFYLLSYQLSRRGHTRLAAYFPVIAVFLAMVAGSLQVGIGHSTYIGFAMTTLTAGILIDYRAGLIMAVLSMLANMSVGFAQANGYLPAAISPGSTMSADTIAMGLGLVVIVIFAKINNDQISEALRREQVVSAELQARHADLEVQVSRRTQDVERRLLQLRTAAEISRVISAVLDPQTLIQKVVELVRERFDLYFVGLFLVDERGEYAVLSAGTGQAGLKMLEESHKLSVGGPSMIGWATSHRQPRIALDVGQEAIRFSNPNLPLTRSELAIPLISGERVIGALTIQSDQPEAFDQDDITVLQGIADSLATALENAHLFQQVQSSLDEVRHLHRQYLSQSWEGVSQTASELNYTFESPAVSMSGEASSIDIPISLRDQAIGKLTIEGDQSQWSPEELAFVQAVTTQTAIALENARLLEETRRLAQRERLLAELTGKVGATADVNVVLRTAIHELGKALHASAGMIRLEVVPETVDGKDGKNGDGEK
jgi:GAF domain-containing protein